MRAVTVLLSAALVAACSSDADRGSVEGAARLLDAEAVTSIRIEATGANFSVGQPFLAGQEWPQVNIVEYVSTIDYGTPSIETRMVREQPSPEPPGGGGRFTGQQHLAQMASGDAAWNTAGSPAGPPQPAPAAVSERVLQVWTTPHGFVKAAQANGATEQAGAEETEVTFTLPSGQSVVGWIDANDHLVRVRTTIDNPVMGDMVVETIYGNYRDFGGVTFPQTIRQVQGGHPALDLTVSSVQMNPGLDLSPPANLTAPPVQTTADPVARGIWYIRGGSHHSVAIEMADHVIVVEGPQSEARGQAVIEEVERTIPGKPIRYVVNTHVHFDHSGGLRPFAAVGATVVTHETNRAFFESAWATPRTLNPDRLSLSGQTATFMTVGDRGELTDGTRVVELYAIQDNPHSGGFLMAYLPAERILVQVDAYTPLPDDAPRPSPTNPNSVALYQNIERLGLQVDQILSLHGPRITTMADLRFAIGM